MKQKQKQSKTTNPTETKDDIGNILVDRWNAGYKRGVEQQREANHKELKAAVRDAYGDGYDKGFEQGRASARKEVGK